MAHAKWRIVPDAVPPLMTMSSYFASRRLRFATLAACFPSAVRVFLGRCAIVFFFLAAAAAFLMLRRAAALCFPVAIKSPLHEDARTDTG